MTKPYAAQVIDRDGLLGTLEQEPSPGTKSVFVQFDNGERVLVSRELFETRADGSYRLNASLANLLAAHDESMHDGSRHDESMRIPVIEESARIERVQTVVGKVRIDKTVQERIEQIDEPLVTEEVEVERVTINRPVDEAPSIRHEGNTLIIPLLEEVLVVEKRLVLREEVHVRKLSKEVRSPQEVSLRSEQIEITRQPISSGDDPGV
jgi:stress response protein YsnF